MYMRLFAGLLSCLSASLTGVVVSNPCKPALSIPTLATVAICAAFPKRVIRANLDLGVVVTFALGATELYGGTFDTMWLAN